MGIFFVLAILAGGFLAGLLTQGPIHSEWLRDSVAARLTTALDGKYDVSIADGQLAWDELHGLTTTFSGIDLRSPGTGLQVTVKSLRLFPNLGSLALGRLSVDKADLTELSARLDITDNGGTSAAGGFSSGDVNVRLASLFDRNLGKIAERVEKFGLRRLSLLNGRLQLIQRQPGRAERSWLVSSIDSEIELDHALGTVRGTLSAAGRAGRWSLELARKPFENVEGEGDEENNSGHQLKIKGTDLTFADFLPTGHKPRRGSLFLLPISPEFAAGFKPDGQLEQIKGFISVGAGYVGLGVRGMALLDEADVQVSWKLGDKHIGIDRSSIHFGETRFLFAGRITPPEPGRSKLSFALSVLEGQIAPRDVGGPPLYVDRIRIKGDYHLKTQFLSIPSFELMSGTTFVSAAGSADLASYGPIVTIAADAGPMNVAKLKRLWPSFVAPDTRDWVVKNVHGGLLKSAKFDIALGKENFDPDDPELRVWPDETVKVTFDFVGATINTYGGLPPISNAQGRGKIIGGLFQLDVTEGTILTKSNRQTKVDRVQFIIPDIRPRRRNAEIEAVLSGPVESLAEVINSPPFAAMEKAGMSPSSLSGQAIALLTASFDLKAELAPEDIEWRVEATLSDFASTEPISGRLVKKANLNLVSSPKEVSITGRALVDGYKIKLDMVQPVGNVGGTVKRDLSLVLSEAERRRKGLDLAPLLTGPVQVDVDAKSDKGQRFTIDLTRARLQIPVFGWTKGAGVRGSASFMVRQVGKTYRVSDILLKAGDLRLAGSAVIGANGKLASADFRKFALRKEDNASLTLKVGRRGKMTVAFKGGQFDGRTLINNLKRRAGTGAVTKVDYDISGNLGKLTGFGGATLVNARFSAVGKAGKLQTLTIIGSANGPMSLELRSEGRRKTIDFTSANTGEVLRFLGIYERMLGGRARMRLAVENPTRSVGGLAIRKFRISEDPALAKLIKSYGDSVRNSNDAISAANASIATSKNTFDRLDAHFTYSNGQISITRSRVSSPLIGVTAEGRIDLNRQVATLRGTFLPVYGLNNIFGKIPILGQALGAGRHGGLVGITFKMVGPIDNPKLMINPVSAVAPGILRKIFEYQ